MKLTVIGCAGSFPGPDSAASCYLLTDTDDAGREWNIVLDLGNGALGALQRHLRLPALDGVLLTHLHPDHCLDVCGLYVTRKYAPLEADHANAREPLPVYGPSGTAARLAAAYYTPAHGALQGPAGAEECAGSAGAAESTGDLSEAFAFSEWSAGTAVSLGPFSVEPFLVRHPVEAYALRITGSGGGVLTYTGDTDECEGALAAARSTDLLLSEAAFHEGRDTVRGIHLTGRRAGELARDAGAGRMVLTHIPAWNDPELARAEAAAVYPGPIDVAAPGLEYPLPARR